MHFPAWTFDLLCSSLRLLYALSLWEVLLLFPENTNQTYMHRRHLGVDFVSDILREGLVDFSDEKNLAFFSEEILRLLWKYFLKTLLFSMHFGKFDRLRKSSWKLEKIFEDFLKSLLCLLKTWKFFREVSEVFYRRPWGVLEKTSKWPGEIFEVLLAVF